MCIDVFFWDWMAFAGDKSEGTSILASWIVGEKKGYNPKSSHSHS